MAEFNTNAILTLASGIYDTLNSPTAISAGYISGILTSSGFLGSINSRLSTSFSLSGDGPAIVGGFGDEESNIASLQYQVTYYGRQALSALQGIGAGFVTQVKDGDSAISREGITRAVSEWRSLRKETEESLQVAVANWKVGHTIPVSVDAAQLAQWPTP